MKSKARIVVVGSINMDMVINSPTLPVKGETILGEDYFTVPGGKGANQAVAASRLGAHVVMFGCLGQDQFGQQLLQHLQNEGIVTDNITVLEESPTGVAFIPVTPSGDNCIVVSPGANMRLTPQHIEQGEEIIKNADVLMVQLEIPMETVRTALQIAKKHNVITILNPAPAKALSNDIYQLTDIITPNETEGSLLAAGNVQQSLSAEAIMSELSQSGVGKVLLTRGGDGVVYQDDNGISVVPACKVEVVDTTAAGDACNAALAVALAEKLNFPEAVEFAVKTSALSVTKAGAQTSLPYRDEVERFICQL
ncbi:ribokinase [Paenibacillus abyssi]|uniref:Ribokinase n=1 Tax=Paenibacillus abyssi TaxID=1340531 RepID=A0A917FN15_9BACL|nr:ribokinase [Paenibacillus abyssi]GGF93607.1 ribokinase [Paenibacillus abyssi]